MQSMIIYSLIIMRFSNFFITTYKETPNDAQVVSHQLMHRAGLIIKTGSGLYSYSPLMMKVLAKVEKIIRDELNKVGCMEIQLPMVTPSELWKESGRWDELGELMLCAKDRGQKDVCLSPTNEESVVDYFKNIAKSYKQLPVSLYQINTKFRDELRPRFGLMRAREFTMKDAYSFHMSKSCLDACYEKIKEAYSEIFRRCGLNFLIAEADAGAMADSDSKTHEFQVLANNGEDTLIVSEADRYAANVEKAVTKRPKISFEMTQGEPEEVHTPNKKNIDEVSAFLGIQQHQCLKTLACMALIEGEWRPVLGILLGDDELSEHKLSTALNAAECRHMTSEELINYQLIEGFIGPSVLTNKIAIIFDDEINLEASYVVGANKKDTHVKGFCPKKIINESKQASIRLAREGDLTVSGNVVHIKKGIEVGHIFQLGQKYTNKLKAGVLDENGKEIFPTMGCYGIGVGRTVAAAIEQSYDDDGIVWPIAIAPYEVLLINTSLKDHEITQKAEELYGKLKRNNIDVILDDRPVSVGVKFKDADLIGFPLCCIVGKKWKEDHVLELKHRKTKERFLVSEENLVDWIAKQKLQ